MSPSLTVPRIAALAELDRLRWHEINIANWADYPAGPDTSFWIAVLGDRLCIKFSVSERDPRAVCEHDLEPVWEDSCVEFFCQLPGSERYFNFEFNSHGVCVASTRLGQNEGVEFLGADRLASIERLPEIKDDEWSLTVLIPLSILGLEPTAAADLRGNFYKCGDATEAPHYLSWTRIDHPTPKFHCPEYFGYLHIDQAK